MKCGFAFYIIVVPRKSFELNVPFILRQLLCIPCEIARTDHACLNKPIMYNGRIECSGNIRSSTGNNEAEIEKAASAS